MQTIDKKDLIGTWVEKEQEYNGEVRPPMHSIIEWTFKENGEALFRSTDIKNNVYRSDNRDRYWDTKTENDYTVISINEEPWYKVISLKEKKLLLESNNKIIYHFDKQY